MNKFLLPTPENRAAFSSVHAHFNRTVGECVISGPFKGLSLPWASLFASAVFPKYLGVYEREVFPALSAIGRLPRRVLVNVGAGEGWYAAGLLFAGLVDKVAAFEMNPFGDQAMRRVMAANGLDQERLMVGGVCTRDTLREVLCPDAPAVLLMDVEGAEIDLLDPASIPALKQTAVLVETHDFARAGITGELVQRFRPTHRVKRMPQQRRDPAYLPTEVVAALEGLDPYCYEFALSEFRPTEMEWLWMVPRELADQGSR